MPVRRQALTEGDNLSRLLKALGAPWVVVGSPDGLKLCRSDHVYTYADDREQMFRKFATLRPMYGSAGEEYFGIPESLDSKSEEELLLKLEVLCGR